MYKRVTAFPNGVIEYNYGDVVIVEDNRGNNYTKSTYYNKEPNGWDNILLIGSNKYSTNKLHKNL